MNHKKTHILICAELILLTASCALRNDAEKLLPLNDDISWHGDTLGLSVTLSDKAQSYLQKINDRDYDILYEALLDKDRLAFAHVILTLSLMEEYQVDESEWNHLKISLKSPSKSMTQASVGLYPTQIDELRQFWKEKINVSRNLISLFRSLIASSADDRNDIESAIDRISPDSDWRDYAFRSPKYKKNDGSLAIERLVSRLVSVQTLP